MEHVKPIGPLRLDGNIAENWPKWKQRWVLYAKASGVDSKDEETQCPVFLHKIGKEALEVYDTFTFTDAEVDKLHMNAIFSFHACKIARQLMLS